MIGAEALLRWSDPEHGSVPPQVFIPLAEESGLIHSLGEWVLRTAAEQCVAWRRAGLPLTVSVNLSARQFYREDLAHRICEIVRAAECEPSWIELEVTETSLMHDLDAIRKVLHRLRDDGFTVAIDDFGTGYSSLTHLKHFPIDTLKIDISFIADLETDPQDAAITEAIIGLARGLGKKVVAEGVGTRAQLDFLQQRGCDAFQGFWISQPLPADRFETFVRTLPGPRPDARLEPRQPVEQRLGGPLPLPLEHQHVREAGQQHRLAPVVAGGRDHVVGGADAVALGAHHQHRRRRALGQEPVQPQRQVHQRARRLDAPDGARPRRGCPGRRRG